MTTIEDLYVSIPWRNQVVLDGKGGNTSYHMVVSIVLGLD